MKPLAALGLLSLMLLLHPGCARAAATTQEAPSIASQAQPPPPPAPGPSPVDLSTPRAAVLSFLTGVYRGDAEAALASCLGTDEQRELVRKGARAFAAVRRLKAGYEKRFGETLEIPGFPSETGDFAREVANMSLSQHGDEAMVGPMLKVHEQRGQWKVLPAALTDQWAGNVPLLDKIAAATAELADELEAGKYATKEAFDSAVEAKLGGVHADAPE